LAQRAKRGNGALWKKAGKSSIFPLYPPQRAISRNGNLWQKHRRKVPTFRFLTRYGALWSLSAARLSKLLPDGLPVFYFASALEFDATSAAGQQAQSIQSESSDTLLVDIRMPSAHLIGALFRVNLPAILAKGRSHSFVIVQQLNRDVHGSSSEPNMQCVERRGLCGTNSGPVRGSGYRENWPAGTGHK
jgi:hypothetical protein